MSHALIFKYTVKKNNKTYHPAYVGQLSRILLTKEWVDKNINFGKKNEAWYYY